MALLEIACFTQEQAITASASGADRILLGQRGLLRAVTPPRAWLECIKLRVKLPVDVPVFVTLSSDRRDSCYTDTELREMQASIEDLRPLVDGFVFGILTVDMRIDVARTKVLVQQAHPLPCIFYRGAIDNMTDFSQTLEDVIATGCRTILLIAGGAWNTPKLKNLVEQAQGRITVMLGVEGKPADVTGTRDHTRATAYHYEARDLTGTMNIGLIRKMKSVLRPEYQMTSHTSR